MEPPTEPPTETTTYTAAEVLAMIEKFIIPDAQQMVPFIRQTTMLIMQIEMLKDELRADIQKYSIPEPANSNDI